MPSVEQRGNSFRVIFRFQGRRYAASLKATTRREADALAGGIERTLFRLERGEIDLPEGTDLVAFLLSDGRVTRRPEAPPPPAPATLSELCDRYLEAHGGGAMEANSLATVRMHLNHFAETLGATFPVAGLDLSHLQRHVDRRRRKTYRGQPLSPVTLRKEVASLRACWNWGLEAKLVAGRFPSRGLCYSKTDEKPPFMTRAEVERRVTPGTADAALTELWDCLYLTKADADDLLATVKEKAAHPWVYPLFAFACPTGARRSEMLRALADPKNPKIVNTLHEELKHPHAVAAQFRYADVSDEKGNTVLDIIDPERPDVEVVGGRGRPETRGDTRFQTGRRGCRPGRRREGHRGGASEDGRVTFKVTRERNGDKVTSRDTAKPESAALSLSRLPAPSRTAPRPLQYSGRRARTVEVRWSSDGTRFVEASPRRLGTDTIDLLQLHGFDALSPTER